MLTKHPEKKANQNIMNSFLSKVMFHVAGIDFNFLYSVRATPIILVLVSVMLWGKPMYDIFLFPFGTETVKWQNVWQKK